MYIYINRKKYATRSTFELLYVVAIVCIVPIAVHTRVAHILMRYATMIMIIIAIAMTESV